MAKVGKYQQEGVYYFECPGCGCHHAIYCGKPNPHNGAKWTFNGDFNKPTCTPSFFITWQGSMHDEPRHVCHFFMTDGKLQYLSDTTHKYSGQTIDMEDVD